MHIVQVVGCTIDAGAKIHIVLVVGCTIDRC